MYILPTGLPERLNLNVMKISAFLGKRDHVSRKQFIWESLAGCWVIALLTFAGYELHFNPAPVGFLFLLIVVCVAILCGFWQASLVSIVACACLDYFFYPPVLRFTINDPQDWVALGAFEISALLVSKLSSREQLNSREAELQRRLLSQLYDLSRSTLLINLHQPPGPQLTQLIQRIFGAEAVAIFDEHSSTTDLAGAWRKDEHDLAKECYLQQADDEDKTTWTSRRLLRVGADSIGALRNSWQPGTCRDQCAGFTHGRHRSTDVCHFQKESQIEASHQGRAIARVAVLDSLAHAVKTPLTAIQAANAGLNEVGTLNRAQNELVTLMDDELNQTPACSARASCRRQNLKRGK